MALNGYLPKRALELFNLTGAKVLLESPEGDLEKKEIYL